MAFDLQKKLKFFRQLDPIDYVLCGTLAFRLNGISVADDIYPSLLTTEANDTYHIYGVVRYIPCADLKIDKYCERIADTIVFLPTAERALVEQIKYEFSGGGEGSFCDSFDRYIISKRKFNYDLLLKVGAEFCVNKETVEYLETPR